MLDSKNIFKIAFYLSLSCFLSINTSRANSSIYKTCTNVRKIPIVATPQDLTIVMCGLKHNYANDQTISNLADSILNTLNILADQDTLSSGEWSKNKKLNIDLETLSKKLSSANQTRKKVDSKTPLQKALLTLNSKWGDIKVRTRPENLLKYTNDFKKILSLTKTGKKVLECYENANGPLISGEKIIEIPTEQKMKGAKMAFTLEFDTNNPNKFFKKILFNSEESPLDSLNTFAHELQHGCNSLKQAELNLQLGQLPPTDKLSIEEAEQEKNLIRQIEQDNAVDEMRAYHVSVDMFKDLLEANPEYFCNSFIKSEIFGTQVLSTAEYAANLEDKFEDGSNPNYIISLYAAHGFYTPENVLVKNKDGLITNRLLPELIKKMKDAGVYVAQ